MRRFTLILTASILLLCIRIVAADVQQPLEPLRAQTAPILDGRLDDELWKNALTVGGFKTYIPDYGLDMLGDTEVLMAYDRENMYFAIRCHDGEPDKIKSSVAARDKIAPDDWICLHIDSYNDHQSMYSFYVNPAGIQMDARAVADAEEDLDVDLVWHSRGRIDDRGYTIEVQIPFKAIRFADSEPVIMGILCERQIVRSSERGTSPPLDPKRGSNFLTQTRTVQYRDIIHNNPFEILPSFTYKQDGSLDRGAMRSDGSQTDLSLNAKFGIISNVVIEGTYNPDFSQVEADAQQVDFNLRYALFYEEKRPFFLEGKEQFAYGGAMMSDELQNVIHTRTIVDPLMGAKLTGKAGGKNTFASMYALDELPENPVEGKYAHVGILRYKRTLDRDSFLGGFLTARDSESNDNQVAGLDGQIRVSGSSHIGFHGFFSRSRASDAPGREEGYLLGATSTYDTRNWHVHTWFRDLSEDFHTDVGYLTRAGITRIANSITRYLYPKSNVFLRLDPMFVNNFAYDKESRLWEHYNALYAGFTLPRNTYVRFGPAYESEVYSGKEFDTSAFRLGMTSQLTKEFSCSLDYQYGRKVRYVADPYQGIGQSGAVAFVYQPASQFNSGLDLQYSDFYRSGHAGKEFDYLIARFKNTYQMNRYLFLRAIVEYNSFHEEFMTDALVSFTYIPGTVIHLGYGSLYAKTQWAENEYQPSDRFLETERGLFFKASYNWIF